MNDKTSKAVKSIGRSIANINKQIDVIREEYPEAKMYVEDGCNYYVMKGDSHCSDADLPQHDNALDCFTVRHSECGAW